jgi:hypothetical protein
MVALAWALWPLEGLWRYALMLQYFVICVEVSLSLRRSPPLPTHTHTCSLIYPTRADLHEPPSKVDGEDFPVQDPENLGSMTLNESGINWNNLLPTKYIQLSLSLRE